jgi:hypothetical protein
MARLTVAFRIVVSGGRDGSLVCWDQDGKEMSAIPEAHMKTEVKMVASVLDGELLVSVGADACRLYSPMATGRRAVRLEPHQMLQPPRPAAPCSYALFVRSGMAGAQELWLSTLSDTVFIYTWDATARQFVNPVTLKVQHESGLRSTEVFIT